MMTCAEAARVMSDGMNRPVERRERLSLQFHLFMCRGCRLYRKQLALIRRWLRSDRLANAESTRQETVRLDAEARARIQTAIYKGFNEGEDTRS